MSKHGARRTRQRRCDRTDEGERAANSELRVRCRAVVVKLMRNGTATRQAASPDDGGGGGGRAYARTSTRLRRRTGVPCSGGPPLYSRTDFMPHSAAEKGATQRRPDDTSRRCYCFRCGATATVEIRAGGIEPRTRAVRAIVVVVVRDRRIATTGVGLWESKIRVF